MLLVSSEWASSLLQPLQAVHSSLHTLLAALPPSTTMPDTVLWDPINMSKMPIVHDNVRVLAAANT